MLTALLALAATRSAALPQDGLAAAADSVATTGSLKAAKDSLTATKGSLSAAKGSLSAAKDSLAAARDSIAALKDSLLRADQARIDSILQAAEAAAQQGSATVGAVGATVADAPLPPIAASARRQKRDWTTWRPDPQKALWLALVFPGGGQIYNRKYWKLPIVYGGFVGCVYALMWNNTMYKDYAQAYLDIMDSDPGTASYNKFLHLAQQITPENEERYKNIFKRRKDKFRRWRDLSFFVMVGIYAVSVIDAYVDAELSNFDISKDLSLRLQPAVIPASTTGQAGGQHSLVSGDNALGLQCSLNF